MTKKLNIDSITNELEGASLFFAKPTPLPVSPSQAKLEPKKPSEAAKPQQTSPHKIVKVEPVKKKTKAKESKPDTMTPRNHDIMVSRYHDTIIQMVRKAVRELGKEAATHRFTIEEKRALADIIYTYKNQGLRTSENEIARIAVNFLIEDYRQNGEASVLDKVLKALND